MDSDELSALLSSMQRIKVTSKEELAANIEIISKALERTEKVLTYLVATSFGSDGGLRGGELDDMMHQHIQLIQVKNKLYKQYQEMKENKVIAPEEAKTIDKSWWHFW